MSDFCSNLFYRWKLKTLFMKTRFLLYFFLILPRREFRFDFFLISLPYRGKEKWTFFWKKFFFSWNNDKSMCTQNQLFFLAAVTFCRLLSLFRSLSLTHTLSLPLPQHAQISCMRSPFPADLLWTLPAVKKTYPSLSLFPSISLFFSLSLFVCLSLLFPLSLSLLLSIWMSIFRFKQLSFCG